MGVTGVFGKLLDLKVYFVPSALQLQAVGFPF